MVPRSVLGYCIMGNKVLLFLFFLGLFSSCETPPKVSASATEEIAKQVLDDHSYSNISRVRTTHLDLELDVDFVNRKIYGVARHSLKNLGTDTVIFDIKGLDIKKITYERKGKEYETDFVIGNMDKDSILGQPLIVRIEKNTDRVSIYYETTSESEALDWLAPQQTSSGKSPFLYTQGQAILGRTWIPLQDSPSNRLTYSAKVKVPSGMMALMSAENPKKISEDGTYNFTMSQPIPSYLIALAVGKIAYHPYSKKCGVYAETELLNKAAYELVDLPRMIHAAEKIYGAYRWGRYDVLLLPYSFPFGGMENPKLTFLNPTIITGDRSLVSVLAHELAHSWSGNLVTNRTWDDFWLNEGFTVYFEHRIMEELYGKDMSEILATIEFQELQDEMTRINHSEHPQDTRLKLDLTGRNPDDGMTQIAYVKGAFFLKTLEATYGRRKFDAFLNSYFKKFAFKSIRTEDFLAYLNEKLILPNKKIEFNPDEWIFEKGLPKNCFKIENNRLQKMIDLANQFASGVDIFKKKRRVIKIKRRRKVIVEQLERNDHITQEWQTFIRALPQNLGERAMQRIDSQLQFSTCGNSELMAEWFVLGIKNNYKAQLPEIEHFLKKVGRRKFLVPIYRELLKKSDLNEFTISVFDASSPNLHAVSRKTIEKMVSKIRSSEIQATKTDQ
ncbi:MAG: hypothetical protein RL264_612 [Bacteroidota bacterium]